MMMMMMQSLSIIKVIRIFVFYILTIPDWHTVYHKSQHKLIYVNHNIFFRRVEERDSSHFLKYLKYGPYWKEALIRGSRGWLLTFMLKTTEVIVAKIKIFGQMAGYWKSSQNKRTRRIGSHFDHCCLTPHRQRGKKIAHQQCFLRRVYKVLGSG